MDRDSLPLAPGYRVRRPLPEDAPEVQALIAASDVAEFGESDGYSLEELRDDWRRFDLDQNVWVVAAPDGALAGYAYVWPRQLVRLDVEVYIDPSHLGRGIGTTLVRLTEARGRELAPQAPAGSSVAFNNWINARNADARALLEREGYRPVRYFWRMEAALPAEPEAPVWPAGITLRSAVEAGDLRPFYDTVEEAMADHWGHVDLTFEEWVERRTGATFDSSLWYLATEGEVAAGAVLCSIGDGVGWVDTLVVRRPWRRRGLGSALLRHAFGELARRGIQRVQLSVDADSPTGATRLYERAGMRVVQEYAGYGKGVVGDG